MSEKSESRSVSSESIEKYRLSDAEVSDLRTHLPDSDQSLGIRLMSSGTECNPNGSTIIGWLNTANYRYQIEVEGEWSPWNTPEAQKFVGPTGDASISFRGKNKWCALIVIQKRGVYAYPGHPISTHGVAPGELPLTVSVIMNDDHFGDNMNKPGDPMRGRVLAMSP